VLTRARLVSAGWPVCSLLSSRTGWIDVRCCTSVGAVWVADSPWPRKLRLCFVAGHEQGVDPGDFLSGPT